MPALVLPAILLVFLAGCSTSSIKPSTGPITFTTVNGSPLASFPASMAAGSTAYLMVNLGNDAQLLGADWTVSCTNEPPAGTPLPPGEIVDQSCGTFAPVHTLGGPVPSYATSAASYVTLYTAPAVVPANGIVTLYAKATDDPSRYSSLTLTVTGLPISIAFAPAPPSTLAVSATASLKAVLTNDYASAGAKWTVACGAAGANACGSFSAAQTASGVATTYTAPSAMPAGSVVTITATSVSDTTKSVSAAITILPVTVTVNPATLSVAASGTGLLSAAVVNDVSNAGVDWMLSCGSSTACGSITAHTASGSAATYTAPSAVPGSGAVTVTATSTADKTASGSALVTVTSPQPAKVNGRVMAGAQPVAGASVLLYATGESGYGSASMLLNSYEDSAARTDDNGYFTVTGGEACPSSASELYLVARSGNAGGGANPNLAFVAALGSCSSFRSTANVTVGEATTVAAAYALSGFMQDAAHIGTTPANQAGLENAFATVWDLVDPATGEARSTTPVGHGAAPRAEIDTLANLLNGCAVTAGGKAGDGSACGDLFSNTGGTATADTLQAAMEIARHPAESAGAVNALFDLANGNGPYQPALAAAPVNWSLALHYSGEGPVTAQSAAVDGSGRVWIADGVDGMPSVRSTSAALPVPGGDSNSLAVDGAGNLWVVRHGENAVDEFVGIATPVASSPDMNEKGSGTAFRR
uniref:Uncharacterized protein n=2 Tax=Paracidobacterium acidisoli TaxID=2303751 RepID=A0A372IJW3_9BACT